MHKDENMTLEQKADLCLLASNVQGQKLYDKKLPDQQHKIDSKKTDCQCQFEIKSYLQIKTILGHYKEDHNREIQLANITYTRLSQVASNKIKVMLKQKVDQKEIVYK